ncbi:MAG: hypothetical protein MJ252_30435, partial [archaeon]|nr:hypothetical protein [archaeon]
MIIDIESHNVIQRINTNWLTQNNYNLRYYKLHLLHGKKILLKNDQNNGFVLFNEDFIPEKFYKIENINTSRMFDLSETKIASVSGRQTIKIFEFN